jgi:hypothetical protein
VRTSCVDTFGEFDKERGAAMGSAGSAYRDIASDSVTVTVASAYTNEGIYVSKQHVRGHR